MATTDPPQGSTEPTSAAPMGISLVLPGYNEEASLEETLRKCLAALAAFTPQHEVIFVDDASTDSTGAIADRLAAELPHVRVVHNPVNLGVGASLLIGMKAARYGLVAHNSVDYPFDLTDLRRVLPKFAEADVVIVVRTDRSAHSPYRKLTSLVNFILIRLLFGVPFRDMNFVQVYRREVLESVRVKARSPAFVTPELLIRARDLGFRIAEVEAPFHRRKKGKAHYGKPHDILWTLADMLSYWLRRMFDIG